MLGLAKKTPGRLQAVERVEEWTREHFKLQKEAAVSVSEVACSLPGCPPLETVVAFWIAEQRYQFKLFKPVAEVVVDDLPFAWLKDALAVQERVGWDCCGGPSAVDSRADVEGSSVAARCHSGRAGRRTRVESRKTVKESTKPQAAPMAAGV